MPRRKVHPVSPPSDPARPRSEAAGPLGAGAGNYALSPSQSKGRPITKRTEERLARYIIIHASEPHLTQRQIAERLGCSYEALKLTLYKATKDGLLRFDEPLKKLKYEVIPQVVDGLADFVKAKDKQAIIETAKATVFKQYLAEEGVADQPNMVLGIKIEMPGNADAKPIEAQIIGKGRELTNGQ